MAADPRRAGRVPGGRQRDQLAMRLETEATPQEFLDALADWDGADARAALTDLRGQRYLQPFLREEIATDVTLYRGAPAAAGRKLLVAFTGRSHRMMIPTPVFLQRITAAEWDVLFLRDSARNHFRDGCTGFADGFPALVTRLAAVARPYAVVQTMGTSMGGLAAARAGLALGARRAVVVGGMPPDDFRRLHEPGGPPPAYDPLCACLPATPRDLIFVHAKAHAEDRQWAGHFAGLTCGATLEVLGGRDHNVMATLWANGRLDAFMALLLGPAFRGPASGGRRAQHFPRRNLAARLRRRWQMLLRRLRGQ